MNGQVLPHFLGPVDAWYTYIHAVHAGGNYATPNFLVGKP